MLQPQPNNNEQEYQMLLLSRNLQASAHRSKNKFIVSERKFLNTHPKKS